MVLSILRFHETQNCNVWGAVDSENNPLPGLWEFKSISASTPRLFGTMRAKRPLTDNLGNLEDLLLSARAWQCIQAAADVSNFEVIPFTVFAPNGTTVSDSYFCIRPIVPTNSVEESKTEFVYFETARPNGKKRVKHVQQWWFDARRIPPYGIFYEYGEWIVHNTIVDVVSENALTGFRFQPIWTDEGGGKSLFRRPKWWV